MNIPLTCKVAAVMIGVIAPMTASAPRASRGESLSIAKRLISLGGPALRIDRTANRVEILLSLLSHVDATGIRRTLSLPLLKSLVHIGPPRLDAISRAADIPSGHSAIARGPGTFMGNPLSVFRVALGVSAGATGEQSAYRVFQQVQQMRLRSRIDRPGTGLRWSALLAAVALRRAKYSAKLIARGHPLDVRLHLSDRDPESAPELMTRCGFIHSRYMENIDWRSDGDASGTYEDWEASPAHAANYRIASLQEAGIGIAPCPQPDAPNGYLVVMVAGAHFRGHRTD